jgi:hypothetical protein
LPRVSFTLSSSLGADNSKTEGGYA